MKFKVGDYIEFSKDRHLIKCVGRITSLDNGSYHFNMLLSNKPIPKNNRLSFRFDGKIIEYVKKLSPEEFESAKEQYRFKRLE